MDGTVYKQLLPSGRIVWRFEITTGKDENGKPLRIRKGGFARKGDAEDEKNKVLRQLAQGQVVKAAPKTFADLMQEWFREHAERHCQPKTVERYRELVAYALPHIGAVQVGALSPLLLERLFNQLKDSGGHNRKTKAPRPLSAKTVRNIASVVHSALDAAVRWRLLTVNPLDACDLPKVRKVEAKALDQDQTAWFIDATRGTWLYPYLWVDAATGCRRGELLALTWSDLTLDSAPAFVTISKSLSQTRAGLQVKPTKTEQPRTLSLPATAVQALREHREQQQDTRRMFGPDYRADLDLVFCTPEGDYLKPDSVTAKVCLVARKLGMPGVSLHTLRHSHGSQLLSKGVPLPTVSKRLGHSSVRVTAEVYSHALAADEIAAADIWDQSVGAAVTKVREQAKQ